MLLRNDPLDAVWRESEVAVDFVHKSKFRDMEDIIVPQQRFIAAMQGRTAALSTFSDAQFDEAAFEAQLLAGDRMPTMICWYWITKAKARFLAGAHAEALAAVDKATALLWSSTGHFPLIDYYYYAALTVAALYENASAVERPRWGELLELRDQLREWADVNRPSFGDKHALVSAEIARLEGRDADAMRLYEQAIQSAREHGFIQNEGVAHELAARFYLSRGSTTAACAHLEEARRCFARWGADGKVRQLDQLYPDLRKEEPAVAPTGTIGTPVEHLDLATVISVSQAVSGEIVLEKLLDTLMRTAIAQAGAERGLLILSRGAEPRIAAEATTTADTVLVQLRDEPVSAAVLPEVYSPLRPAHAGECHSRRCRGPTFVCRGSVHPAASRPVHSRPAAAQPGQAYRGALSREQPGAPRLRAGPDRGAEAARLPSRDLAGEYPLVPRPCGTRSEDPAPVRCQHCWDIFLGF